MVDVKDGVEAAAQQRIVVSCEPERPAAAAQQEWLFGDDQQQQQQRQGEADAAGSGAVAPPRSWGGAPSNDADALVALPEVRRARALRQRSGLVASALLCGQTCSPVRYL